MDTQFRVNDTTVTAWSMAALGARMYNLALEGIPDPAPGSNLWQVNSIYPYEKASDWCRSYISAALEHTLYWADVAMPLSFASDHVVRHTLRPVFTLSRAAIESAAQAVWLLCAPDPVECARRHLSLIRWDYDEHRKSAVGDDALRRRVTEAEERLLERTTSVFEDSQTKKPSLLAVIREAAAAVEMDPDRAERIWRASSGVAHGKAWPSNALQSVYPLSEYEPGHFRTLKVPDPDRMTEVLQAADKLTSFAVLQYAAFSGADLDSLLEEARLALVEKIPVRPDVDPDLVARLNRRRNDPTT